MTSEIGLGNGDRSTPLPSLHGIVTYDMAIDWTETRFCFINIKEVVEGKSLPLSALFQQLSLWRHARVLEQGNHAMTVSRGAGGKHVDGRKRDEVLVSATDSMA